MSPQPTIRLLVVDDQEFVRDALGVLAETAEDIELVGLAAEAREGVRLCCEVQPDVVLLDMMLARRPDGIFVARAIRILMPGVRIVILSGFATPDLIKAAFRAGTMSYLLKDAVSVDTLADAIRRTFAGQAVIAPEVARHLGHS